MALIPDKCKRSESCLIRPEIKNKKIFTKFKGFQYISSLTAIFFPTLFADLVNCEVNYNDYKTGANRLSYYHEDLQYLPGNQLDLQFLTNVKGSSLHQSNKFHVVNATFLQKPGISYILHISKAEGMDARNANKTFFGGSDARDLDCLFSGSVTEINEGNNEKSKYGQVAFSSCHHGMGFEGLILLPDEHYYIHPKTSIHSSHSIIKRSAGAASPHNSIRKPSISHKAYRVNDGSAAALAFQGGKHVDRLRLPSVKGMNEALKYLPDLDQQEDEEDSELLENSLNGTDEEDGMVETTFLENVGCFGASCDKLLPPVMVPLARGNNKNNNKNKNPSNSASGNKVVEIAVFTDESLYKTWQSRYPKNTKTSLKQYVLAIVNNMNAFYSQPSMTEKITFRLVYLEIQSEKPKALDEHNADDTKYLTSFCQYSARKNEGGSLWDHSLLLTGLNLEAFGSGDNVAGIAWFSTMCFHGFSCSLIEAFTFGSAFTATHEMGHRMDHDGVEGPGVACAIESHIMSPSTGGGQLGWSTCSVKSMKDFISNGYMNTPPPKCITKKGPRTRNSIKFTNSKPPGQQFDATTQCATECNGCVPYTTAPYDENMCHLLFCTVPGSKVLEASFPALEGTTCTSGKKCHQGKCV